MSAALQDLDIFELRPLITNLNCKLSTITEYATQRQLLCLVSEENDIVLRYTNEGGQEVLKMISWFRKTNRVIHDVCFDPTGTWLLVLCFDNTLHIVPALAVVDRTYLDTSNTTLSQQLYSSTQVTSYIIPFVGPHECPNSKKCPNHDTSLSLISITEQCEKDKNAKKDDEYEIVNDNLSNKYGMEKQMDNENEQQLEAFSHDIPEIMRIGSGNVANVVPDSTGNSHVMANSFMVSSTCPYPLSVVWWQTVDGLNRAAIGYSDGSICFVGLSPMCPFVASTSIESGSVVKLFICKDNTYESIILFITSSLKQQYKLLLEQKAIKYLLGDISPTNIGEKGFQTSNSTNDWQIVIPMRTELPNTSSLVGNSSFPSTTESSNEDGGRSNIIAKDFEEDEQPSTSAAAMPTVDNNGPLSVIVSPTSLKHFRNITLRQPTVPPPSYSNSTGHQQIPPPPPYSVAITRHLDSAPITTSSSITGGIRCQQENLSDLDDIASKGTGIIPATRARLASLKSLGSKKLQAIRMRLSDNRQKLEECIPENNLGASFEIMETPSLTPELLGKSQGSYYTIQNLQSTYFLSALHSETNSLSVHLKPPFLYKIPKNSLDILISSNILYLIQYVPKVPDISEEKNAFETVYPQSTDSLVAVKEFDAVIEISDTFNDEERNNGNDTTEKENRDRDVEKQEKYIEESTDLKMKDVENDDIKKKASTDSPNMVNAIGVISTAMATLRSGDEDKFNVHSHLGLFRFEHETVLNLYQMTVFSKSEYSTSEGVSKDEKPKNAYDYKNIRTPADYVNFYENNTDVQEEYSLRQMEIMKNEFPKIHYDPCYVITNKNIYYIQLKKEAFALFLDAALNGEWRQCREFCNTFNLNFETCIEFAGDYLLRRKKVTQALLTYNTARIKPIRTALKLAIYGHTCALMHLCAMALKTTFLIKAQHFSHPIIKSLMADITCRHSEDIRPIIPKNYHNEIGVVNEGAACSDYVYGVHEPLCNLQMSASSQFHLANLLLITLAEKAVNDKNYLPLWNFLVTNTKYHTNMTGIVLCQSGLFSAALILAKTRGACIDTFLALTNVVSQEFGWYTELNVCLYNLSEPIFTESITYLPHIAIDYFSFIQDKLDNIRLIVLKRLEQQLNPFSAILRPIVSHTSCLNIADNNMTYSLHFCKNLIETYLAVLIHMESQWSKTLLKSNNRQNITNALSTFRITYEDNQFAIDSRRFKPISAGCAHCACVLDGVAYFWGSNGVPCSFSVNKSSDPPEPPYAVKNLELLSQLNLEVHAVKCGRQHTLVLTNNGLYTFGNNHLCQLGIGFDMLASLQPMLVHTLDGKNITILEAGQYHNAAVADGKLYTWGWGVYGQLGHGITMNESKPRIVSFFKTMHVIQVSLGHAHSLVLCLDDSGKTQLFVFGSNHFGQLGIGTGASAKSEDMKVTQARIYSVNELNCSSQVKSLLPIKLDVTSSRIRLIHTKFFTNLVVDENENMYTWGSSPQALRLANQIKKRANAKQKSEEHQRREMSKRFEAILTLNTSNDCSPTNSSSFPSTDTEAKENINMVTKDIHGDAMQNICGESEIQELCKKVETLASLEESHEPTKEECTCTSNEVPIEILENVSNGNEVSRDKVLDDDLHSLKELEAINQKDSIKEPSSTDNVDAKYQGCQQKPSNEVDPCEHMTPQLVDTSEVAGQILQISSGLFHFALISSSCTLYTWGKNLEHQLGTVDKERRAVNKPSPIDIIERPMYVDCGADFTLVMTTEYLVKAFGGNSNGQCGRDLGSTMDKMKQRVVCLPTTKRFMRFESQCVEAPVEINLPRPRIRLENEPVRYLKSIPRFKKQFVQEAIINLDGNQNCNEEDDEGRYLIERQSESDSISPSRQYKLTTLGDSESDRDVMTCQDSEDLLSSLENYSNKEDGSSVLEGDNFCASMENISSAGNTPEEQRYPHLLPNQRNTQNADDNCSECLGKSEIDKTGVCKCSNNNAIPSNENQLRVYEDQNFSGFKDEVSFQQYRHYIHYCLYIFHGLYNPDKIREFAKDRLEYRIRTHMLNFKFIDAFKLCLQACDTSTLALRIFEYFTRDTSNYVHVPVRRKDLKFLIYYLLLHFFRRKFNIQECERFFISDIDYYLFELAYVLYFNNNNTAIEQTLNQKFKDLICMETEATILGGCADNNEEIHKLEETDVIFDMLSVKFKTIVCQRLLKYCGKSN